MPSAVRKDSTKPHRAGLAFEDACELLLCASHDLRSPFAAIKLSAESIEGRWRKGEPISDTEWASAMRRISKAADGALRLMEDLVSVDRLRAGPRMSKKTSSALVDVTEVIGDAVSLQREHLDRARCEVTVRCAEGVTARGRWDRASLLRIFSNLLQNAIRYAPGGPVRITLFPGENRLGIRFADHGPGFSGTRGFTAAVVGPDATRRHGLGLWIVRRAVAELGGTLAVASDPDRGTTFTIEIPGLSRERRNSRAMPRRAAAQLPDPSPASGRPPELQSEASRDLRRGGSRLPRPAPT